MRKNSLLNLKFDNSFITELPGDKEEKNSRRQVKNACYSYVTPTTVSAPQLISYSSNLAKLLDIAEEDCRSELFSNLFSGNELLEGMTPFAMCYGGHQFGGWAGQLGDGRAINLGEVINSQGDRWLLQLKGAGPTPYSRTADGLAVLRSSLREFLCSEAMHYLGVPTTRALSLVATGEFVDRDMFYNGNIKEEPGAVVCRVSPSFVRFGNFEILAAQKNVDLLQRLADYVIQHDFPEFNRLKGSEKYLSWFKKVTQLTVDMIIHWLRVGFVHGVMNTDNMSILGLTIDYGPYGWLEGYEPGWTPNTTDAKGHRYAFGNQAYIGQWNLTQLANALHPIIQETKGLEEILGFYVDYFQKEFNHMMVAKLGLMKFEVETDKALIDDLQKILQLTETDMTIFFRNLSDFNPEQHTARDGSAFVADAYYSPENLEDSYYTELLGWFERYRDRILQDKLSYKDRKELMNKTNPKYVLRNYMAQVAIDKAEAGDNSEIENLLNLLANPYDEQPENERYFARRPEWARNKPGCSMLSCSS